MIPLAARRATASTTGAAAWPTIAPVSPRQRSAYSRPSRSVTCAPLASASAGGNPDAHFAIQLIGTPASSERLVRSNSARERGCSAAKSARSAAVRSARRARSIPSHRLLVMAVIIALSEAWKADLALIGLFGIVFPALVTGLIVFAAAQMVAERKRNLERRHGH